LHYVFDEDPPTVTRLKEAGGAAALSFIPVVGTVAGAVVGGIFGDVLAGLL
jgi:hypothetical protein